MKLNIGCGEMKFDGFVNIDIEPSTKPDLICDLRKSDFPYASGTVDKIYCIHNIEHIELQFWPHVFTEFARVLKKGGELVLMYPEFEICVQYYFENKRGLKDFWRACIYGRQSYPGDYHVTPVESVRLQTHLLSAGFQNIKWKPEPEPDEAYTILKATKGEGFITKEKLYRKEIFGLCEN